MFHDYLYNYTLSIVFVGEFNPIIMQPYWLASKGLIRESEANSAVVEIIHNEMVRFDLDWMSVDINKKRFEIKTKKDAYFEPLRDLGISILKILKEFPVAAVGINHVKDFSLSNQESFYNFGNKLSPLENWDGILNDPKLLSLEILELERHDKRNGNYRVRIHSSDEKLGLKFGVTVNINDHYITSGTSGTKGVKGTEEIIDILQNSWKYSIDRSYDVAEKLWSKINNNL